MKYWKIHINYQSEDIRCTKHTDMHDMLFISEEAAETEAVKLARALKRNVDILCVCSTFSVQTIVTKEKAK